eukprot:649525-Prymnesium_polylepis.1
MGTAALESAAALRPRVRSAKVPVPPRSACARRKGCRSPSRRVDTRRVRWCAPGARDSSMRTRLPLPSLTARGRR